jgi:protein TonB
MPRSIHFTRFVTASVILHILFFAAVFWLARFASRAPQIITPVNIVELPKDVLKQLPPLSQPAPVPPPPAPVPRVRERTPPPKVVPTPKKFGTSENVTVPKTLPAPGLPGGSKEGTKETGKTGAGAETGKTGTGSEKGPKGPLPFLTQADIDEYARRGMPQRAPGDDSVTLDTDEFKFMSYNRWLKLKVESILQYPELAAVSGIQGTLYIKFDILKDGTLGDLELLKSSGYRILDDEALRAIRASAPFQPLPDNWHMDRYSIRAAVLFYLNGAYIR